MTLSGADAFGSPSFPISSVGGSNHNPCGNPHGQSPHRGARSLALLCLSQHWFLSLAEAQRILEERSTKQFAFHKGTAIMASNKFSPSGRMDLAYGGYRLIWGPQGLRVEVLDYHAPPLDLSWNLLRGLVDAVDHESDGADPS